MRHHRAAYRAILSQDPSPPHRHFACFPATSAYLLEHVGEWSVSCCVCGTQAEASGGATARWPPGLLTSLGRPRLLRQSVYPDTAAAPLTPPRSGPNHHRLRRQLRLRPHVGDRAPLIRVRRMQRARVLRVRPRRAMPVRRDVSREPGQEGVPARAERAYLVLRLEMRARNGQRLETTLLETPVLLPCSAARTDFYRSVVRRASAAAPPERARRPSRRARPVLAARAAAGATVRRASALPVRPPSDLTCLYLARCSSC